MQHSRLKRWPAIGQRLRACAPALSLFALSATAGSLTGTVTNEAGEPLAKVPVCLQSPEESQGCIKVRSSDRNGDYQFTGLKEAVTYRVTVFQDDSAAGRKFERYRTYVWEPRFQDIRLQRRNETLATAGFVGKFNFSNFQRGLTLTATDFPELASLDLAADYVVLKVFIPTSDPSAAPETIYLGRVANLEGLQIAASLPLSASRIDYQIYNASFSIAGSIALSES